MPSNIETNALESTRFGIRVGRLADLQAPLDEINTAAREQQIDMITTRVDASALERVHALEADGYRLMDTLVYYEQDLKSSDTGQGTDEHADIRLARAEDAPEVAFVAERAFAGYMGHYHTDPRLDNAAADAAYVEWATSSIAHTTPQTPALVATCDDKIAGFLTLRRNSETEFEIVLNAVHPDRQRGGLYTSLIRFSRVFALKGGADRLIISTQLNNYAVQKVWARQGFTHYKSLYTFHKWFT